MGFGGNPVAGGFMGFPSVGGTLFNDAVDRRNAAEENNWANEAAEINRNFQGRMANTAHQREVKDLKAAGLNPVLTANGGSGSATPPGATASTATHSKQSPLVQGGRMDFVAGKTADLLEAQTEAQQASAKLSYDSAAKVRKETRILAPQSTIMDKVNQMFQSSPKADPNSPFGKFLDDMADRYGQKKWEDEQRYNKYFKKPGEWIQQKLYMKGKP